MFVYLILHHFIKQGDIQYIGAGNVVPVQAENLFYAILYAIWYFKMQGASKFID